MTTECYYSACPHHSIHDEPDEGPFCFEPECKATPDQQAEYETKLRLERLKRKGYTEEDLEASSPYNQWMTEES